MLIMIHMSNFNENFGCIMHWIEIKLCVTVLLELNLKPQKPSLNDLCLLARKE